MDSIDRPSTTVPVVPTLSVVAQPSLGCALRRPRRLALNISSALGARADPEYLSPLEADTSVHFYGRPAHWACGRCATSVRIYLLSSACLASALSPAKRAASSSHGGGVGSQATPSPSR
jgi:hypothetical protein